MENINLYFDVYRIDQSGERIEIQNSNYFESSYINQAKKEVELMANEIDSWEEGDFLLITLTNDSSKFIFDGKIFNNGKWKDLTDVTIIENNKYILFYQSEEFTFENTTLEIVKEWEEILKNFKEFDKLEQSSTSTLLKTYSQFFHWYYLPDHDIFAPSKFLGYKDRTIETYDSNGTGGETQKALSKYFKKLPKDSEEFKRLYERLRQVSKNHYGKELSSQIFDGKGGIYIPIKQSTNEFF